MKLGLLVLTGITAVCAQKPAFTDALDPLAFLVGSWAAQGGGVPGSSSGEFSFQLELDRHILVRHNYAQNAKGLPPGTLHDDLLVVYLEDTPRAIYFDSEGHVIRYTVKFPQADSVVFESDGTQKGPRYRLSYVLKGKTLQGTFEIASSETAPYQNYLSWTAVRKTALRNA